jgi:hypothetical protein
MRRSLPLALALLLALFVGADVPQASVDHAPRSATASSAARTSEAPAQSSTSATVEPPAAFVGAALVDVVADRARVLHAQLVTPVRAARAPPLTRI